MFRNLSGTLFCLLVVVLFSGCATWRYPKSATETYITGHKDGSAAAAYSITGILAGITFGPDAYVLGISEPLIPEEIQKKIENKPAEYQKGFIEGYRISIESDAYIFGMICE